MNWLDILIALFIIYFVLKGMKRGLVQEALGLAGVVVAFTVATVKMNSGASLVSKYISIPPTAATVIGFIVIFLIVFLIFKVAAQMLRGLLSIFLLGWIDRFGGLTFGLLKGSLIASLLLLFIPLLPLPIDPSPHLEKSTLAIPTKKVAPTIFDFLKSKFPQTKLFYEELWESVTENSSIDPKKVEDNKVLKAVLDSIKDSARKEAGSNDR